MRTQARSPVSRACADPHTPDSTARDSRMMRRALFLLACSVGGAFLGVGAYLGYTSLQARPSTTFGVAQTSSPTATTASSNRLGSADVGLPTSQSVGSMAGAPTDGLANDPSGRTFSRHSYHDGIARVSPSVVSLYSSETIYRAPKNLLPDGSISPTIAPQERRSTSQGSGVIISSDGIVLTNFHLVRGADEINVVLSDGSLHRATLLGSDRETDLAVVKINATGLPAVPIDGGPHLRVGDIVLAIGNPFGVGQTVTQGIVSATRRHVAGASAWQNFVQIDAAINPGNSGGALINPDGQLVGVNTAVFLRDNGAEGIGFAIPAELLAQVVPQIIANGHVIRGWLGIGADDLPMFPDINRAVDQGAVITGVLQNSPAAISGLQAYDVVTRIGDARIHNATELLLLVSSLTPGSEVPMEILRRGESLELGVRLGERPVFEDLTPQ